MTSVVPISSEENESSEAVTSHPAAVPSPPHSPAPASASVEDPPATAKVSLASVLPPKKKIAFGDVVGAAHYQETGKVLPSEGSDKLRQTAYKLKVIKFYKDGHSEELRARKAMQKRGFRLDSDFIALLSSIIFTLSQIFRLGLASLLAVFVPQDCGGFVCSLNDNFSNLTTYNKAVLAINFITFFVLLVQQIVIAFRERWMIEYLDENRNLPALNLPQALVHYPQLSDRLYKLNEAVKYLSIGAFFFIVINCILSGVLVFNFYYLDFRTVSVFLGNTGLVWGRVWACFKYSRQSAQKGTALSLTSFQPVSFNVVDADHLVSDSPSSAAAEEGIEAV